MLVGLEEMIFICGYLVKSLVLSLPIGWLCSVVYKLYLHCIIDLAHQLIETERARVSGMDLDDLDLGYLGHTYPTMQ